MDMNTITTYLTYNNHNLKKRIALIRATRPLVGIDCIEGARDIKVVMFIL